MKPSSPQVSPVSSPARTRFLSALRALEQACDAPNVRGVDEVGSFLRKGLTVAAFNTLEGFLTDRWQELATYVNSGHTGFLDLPDDMQQSALERTINVARAELRRNQSTPAERIGFLARVGDSLAAVNSGLNLSPLVLGWEGSNLTSEDVVKILRLFHVDSPWVTMLELTSKFGFPAQSGAGALNLSDEFKNLSRLRNQAAHSMQFSITSIQLRTLPPMISRLGFGIDSLMSVASARLHAGDHGFLCDSKSVTTVSVAYSRVVERVRDFAVYRSANSRAKKTGKDGDKLFQSVSASADRGHLVVKQNVSGGLVDWSVGGPG